MNCLYFGILLAFGFWTLTAPSDAFIARSTGCHHNGTWYADKSLVPTVEKCLNCQCNRKTLVCRMKVCPEIPMPPPRGCVVVQKKNTCCPYLSCARLEAFYKIPITRRIIAYLDHYERESIDRVVNDNMLQRRSDDSEADLLVCVKNGTVYKSGSAMSSSNLCSYCYCIGGTEKCVKPKCMLPVEGCKPIFVDSTCCPVRYDCSTKTSGKSSQEVRYRKIANKHFLRMSQRQQRNRGCTVNKQFYAEGQKMKTDIDKPCDICFCIRGSRRCAPKKCAPSLKNCIPVVPKGQCCPSSYDCGSQRDYRRSQNSRQFNLFSLLFGKDENKPASPSSAGMQAHYPNDRDPALTAGTNEFNNNNDEIALEGSSEKSILESIKEGLEFIDGNTNDMLEENMDPVNLQAKRESIQNVETTTTTPVTVDEMSTTTELSFLGLILGESSEVPEQKEEINASEQTNQPIQDDEISWFDILLGPDEQQPNKTHQVIEDNTTEYQLTTTPSSIDRLDTGTDEFGASGEILIGSNADQMEMTTEGKNLTVTNETFFTSSESQLNKNIIKTQKLNSESQNLYIQHDSSEKFQTQTEEIEYIPLKELKPEFGNTASTEKPTDNKDLFTAFLDGISNILGPESAENTFMNTKETQIVSSTSPAITKPTKSLPNFKPLPLHKTHQNHSRINSKIANISVGQPTPLVKNQTHKTSFKPLYPITIVKQENKLKNKSTSTATPSTTTATTTTTTTTTTTPKPLTTTTKAIKTTTEKLQKSTTIASTTTKPTTKPTKTTTPKPLIIKTNPSILESDPLDDSTEPTLPPSLPNLKIIPFLPTDAVETANTKIYEYFPGSATNYEDHKVYADTSKNYASYAVDLENDNEAKYIYKFKVEGPESDPLPEVIPKTPTDDESFLKYDLTEKNGFSPPTKTEGGFVPKEPLPIEDSIVINGELNASKLNEIFPATMHIIDITTPETISDNFTNIIEITTPDPFKDVIHTEPPPDLAIIIQDKVKIEAMAQKANNTLIDRTDGPTNLQKPDINITMMKPTKENVNAEGMEFYSTLSTPQKNKNKIETLLDILFKEEREPLSEISEFSKIPIMTTSTIPPFKSLPETTANLISTLSTTTTSTIKRIISNQTTRKPIRTKLPQNVGSKTRTKTNSTRRITTTLTNKQKTHKTTPATIATSTSSPILTSKVTTTSTTTTSTPPMISTAIKTTKLPISKSKPTTTTTISVKTTQNPFLMSPFDKLPFMNASFEIKRQKPTTTSTATTSSIPTTFYSLERLEGLEAAYDIANTVSSSATTAATTTPASVVHSPYGGAVNEKHSISTTNNLIDPTGILKLAGCNIYGRMYRVGRIILELSSPCVECKCTETGVKCGQLDC